MYAECASLPHLHNMSKGRRYPAGTPAEFPGKIWVGDLILRESELVTRLYKASEAFLGALFAVLRALC